MWSNSASTLGCRANGYWRIPSTRLPRSSSWTRPPDRPRATRATPSALTCATTRCPVHPLGRWGRQRVGIVDSSALPARQHGFEREVHNDPDFPGTIRFNSPLPICFCTPQAPPISVPLTNTIGEVGHPVHILYAVGYPFDSDIRQHCAVDRRLAEPIGVLGAGSAGDQLPDIRCHRAGQRGEPP